MLKHTKNTTKTLWIVWRVIINIITVVIVLGIFSVAYTEFETVVFAILVLIYLSVGTFSSLWGLHTIEFGEALNNEFEIIKRLINKEATQEIPNNIEYTNIFTGEDVVNNISNLKNLENSEEKRERVEKKKQLMIKFYINAGFQTLIYIITLFNLFLALI